MRKLRFKEFSGEWEEKILKDIISTFSGGTPASNNKEYYDGNIPFIRSGEINSKNTALFINEKGLTNSSAKLVEIGDILYALYGATSGEVAISKINGAINQAVLCLRTHENKYFVKFWLESMKEKILNTFLQGGQGNLSAQIIKNLSINIPNQSEQQKIANFFELIDQKIQLQKQKIDLLQEQKKGFLQKMFPKAGEKKPQVRFAGFTGDWEHRKLSDGMVEYTDRVYIKDEKIYKQISVKNIGEITVRGEKIGAEIGRKRQAKVNLNEHPNTLIFTRQTVEQGGIGFAPEETNGAIVTENMPTIDVNTDIFNRDYLLAFVKTLFWYRNIILVNIEGGTAQVAIHEDSILSSESLFPKIEEQKKIGQFFKMLNTKMETEQQKLEALQEQKKGFMQQMFI